MSEVALLPLVDGNSPSEKKNDSIDIEPTDRWLIKQMLSGLEFDDIVTIFRGYGDQFAHNYPDNHKYTIALARYIQAYSAEEFKEIHAEFISTLKQNIDEKCKDDKVTGLYQKGMIDLFVGQKVCWEKLEMLRTLNDDMVDKRITLESVLAEREQEMQTYAMNEKKAAQP